MREEISPSGRLIAQCLSERICCNGDQQKILLSGEMPRSCFTNLLSRREMEVPIMSVDRRTLEETGLFSASPESLGANFVDHMHKVLSSGESLKEQPERGRVAALRASWLSESQNNLNS